MERSFEAVDLVLLPVLDTNGAVALGEALLTRSRGEKLTGPVSKAARRLRQALAALRDAARARLPAGEEEDDRRVAYVVESAAWRSTFDWLAGWTRLSEERAGKKVREAKQLHAVLFDDGLKFLKLPHKLTWAEADHRIQWLAHESVVGVFEELGGVEFLEQLRAAHKKYGEALGITKAGPPARDVPSVREPLDSVRIRLRQYVVQVVAYAEAGGDQAKDRADRLLAPLASWDSQQRTVRPEVNPEAPAAPAAPAPATPTPVP